MRSCLLGIVAVLLLTKLIHSEAVFAREHLPEQQVLIVRYVDRNQLADLANRYDVVEVDAETQTVRIFSNQITRDALAAEGFTWMVDVPYTALINTEVKPLAGQTSGIPGFLLQNYCRDLYFCGNARANYPNLVELIDIGDSGKRPKFKCRLGYGSPVDDQ